MEDTHGFSGLTRMGTSTYKNLASFQGIFGVENSKNFQEPVETLKISQSVPQFAVPDFKATKKTHFAWCNTSKFLHRTALKYCKTVAFL